MVGIGFISVVSPGLVSYLSPRANWWVVDNLSRFYSGPLVSLDPDTDGKESAEKDYSLHAHLLSIIHLGFGSPVEELSNILGHLGGGSRGSIFIFDKTIEKNTGHSDSCILHVSI